MGAPVTYLLVSQASLPSTPVDELHRREVHCDTSYKPVFVDGLGGGGEGGSG